MGKASKRIACLFLLQIIVLSVANPLVGFAQTSSPPEALDTSAAANVLGVAHGMHVRPVFIDYGGGAWYSYGHEIMAINDLVGKDLAIVMYFVPWSSFDPFLLDEIQKHVPQGRRPVIMLTWEPSSNSAGCNLGYGDGQGPIRSVNSGRCDDYIRSYARALKARPERFILRFAHEMNITDSQWWPGRYNMDASSYVDMYRRARAIFRAEGATNVEWMWSPNYASNPPDAWNNIYNYYPGDADVDWIGLSGYNWYGWRSRPWESFDVLYEGVLNDLACRYAKPVIIAEIGSVDGPSDNSKASWITDVYDELDEFPFVRGITWFNDFAYEQRGNADFRVTTGAQDCHNNGGCSGVQPLPGAAGQLTTNAYLNGVRQSVYSNKLPSLAQATPPYTLCSGPTRQFSLDASTVNVGPDGTASVVVQGFLYSSQAQISAEMPSGIRGMASPTTLAPPWGTSTVRLTADAKLAPGVYQGTIKAGSTSLPVTIRNLKVRTYLPSVR